MERYNGSVISSTTGHSTPNASVTVYKTGTGNLAPLFSDNAGVSSISNPVLTDTYGRYNFCTYDGKYDIQISGAGITTYTLYDQSMLDNKVVSPAGVNFQATWSANTLF